ncbi:MAG: hypothetical protein AB7O62_16100 [Pirellulales bacterium]
MTQGVASKTPAESTVGGDSIADCRVRHRFHRRWNRLRGFAAIGLLFALASSASAQTAPPELAGVRIGFNGMFKIGHWTPVEVTFKGGSESVTGRVEITVPDCDGVPSRVVTAPQRPVRLTPGQNSSALLYVRFGQEESTFRVAFREQERQRLLVDESYSHISEIDPEHPPTLLTTDKQLIVSVGTSVGLEDGRLVFPKSQREQIQVARLDGDDAVSRLPTRWYGYEGVSTLVLATNQPDIYRLLENNERLTALEQWVRLGGRLVVFAGSSAPAILAGGEDSHPLAQFVPAKFEKMTTLTQLTALEQYAESKHPVPLQAQGQPLSLPQLTAVTGTVVASEGGTPLVIRSPRGFGEVVFVAADLNVAPLSKWEGRREFLAKLMNWKVRPEEEDESNFGQRFSHLGFTDLAGQLRGSLDQFTGIRVVPFVVVALLIVAYILLIGPGDYFFVKKILKKMEWTWVTFPIIVVLFSLLAYTLARWSKGSHMQMNQIDLVDIDVESKMLRGTTWANLFSPGTQSYDLSIKPQPIDGDAEAATAAPLGWMGLPGGGLGGMSNRSSPSLFQQAYEYSPELDAMLRVPIAVWDTKSLTARYTSESDLDLDADLTSQNDDLAGVLTNTLDVPLEDCLLAHGRHAYALKRIAPGQTVEISRRLDRSDLQTYLTGRKLDYDQQKKVYVQSSTPYDQQSFDVPSILRQMMFYEAGGGGGYAGLTNDYQRFVDLSSHLQTGRAILIGFTRLPGGAQSSSAAILQNNGQPIERENSSSDRPDKHWTCYRFVFPVKVTAP